jgi:hypothetical protein
MIRKALIREIIDENRSTCSGVDTARDAVQQPGRRT